MQLSKTFVIVTTIVAIFLTPVSALSAEDINPRLVQAEYAVRGPVLDLAKELKEQLKEPAHNLPFNELIFCNIGNPQALGQKPLSFTREVLSLMQMPSLLNSEHVDSLFSEPAQSRAREYLSELKSGVGAYSDSQGYEFVRRDVASFITARDGAELGEVDKNDIFLTDGASAGVKMLYQATFREDREDGILVPIPQYPLYSAMATLSGAHLVGYYLDEETRWATYLEELQHALQNAKDAGVHVRAMVVINPGNPTGQCLDRDTQQKILRFCIREGLVLLADEVYQENVYVDDRTFTSFRKIALEMGDEVSALQLVSFHSISKGFTGECGLRGGYFHLHNFEAAVFAQLKKLASISLCSNTVGQLATGLMVRPPKAGSAAHEEYLQQRDGILASLRRRAKKISAALNELEGVSCNEAEGAMYLFPRIHLPATVITAAQEEGFVPDTFYCVRLLQSTGIVVVPGSGFKQVNGTYHFRATILPPEDKVDSFIARLAKFHADFISQYPEKEL